MILSYSQSGLSGKIELPSSKSISHRALIIRGLCRESFEIKNLSTANDTILLTEILDQIKNGNGMIRCYVHDAGTPLRFLLSFLAIQQGSNYVLEGSARLNERPIRPLVDSLATLGASIEYLQHEGYPPMAIHGKQLNGSRVAIDATISSQFISSLCLIAPTLPSGLSIELKNEIVSDPYIDMTLTIMRYFGVAVSKEGPLISIRHQNYIPAPITIESDWSSACFIYTMCMLSDRAAIQVNGLSKESMQGDQAIVELAAKFGIETTWNEVGITLSRSEHNAIIEQECLNLKSYPDLAIPLIVACAVRYPQISFCGIEHLEWKESKRITALQTELLKVGIRLKYVHDILHFEHLPLLPASRVTFSSHNDHRIVMALSMLALTGWKIKFDETACVKKSFPGFFEQLKNLGFKFKNEDQNAS